MSPCVPHASPLLPRRASAVPVESQGSRTHTTQPPLQSTTDHHRPMTSFTLPSDNWAPVRITCHSLYFPLLNRLRFSGSLHRSPSIQLHLQHDSMVDDQFTHAPHRLQALCIHHLESIPRQSCRSHTGPRGLRHVFPRPEVGHHQHHAPTPSSPIHHRLLYQPTCIDPVRLSSPSQTNLFDCNHALPCAVSARTSKCIA